MFSHVKSGYIGKVISCGPTVGYEVGLSDEVGKIVQVEVNLDAPENAVPRAELEETENIQVHLIPLNQLHHTLLEMCNQGFTLDVKLYTYSLATTMVTFK